MDYRKLAFETWERLEKYGHIKNFKRPFDNKNYNIVLNDGLVKVTRTTKNAETKIYTVDTFLYLWMIGKEYNG